MYARLGNKDSHDKCDVMNASERRHNRDATHNCNNKDTKYKRKRCSCPVTSLPPPPAGQLLLLVFSLLTSVFVTTVLLLFYI
jgi:hypothetical protein